MPVLRVGPSTIGRSGQWLRKAGGAVLALALGCAFAPYAAAHPGHSHGPHADGRLPGQPDLVKKGEKGKIVFRFLPKRKEYEVRHPGRPTGYAHVDPLGPGVAANSGEAESLGGWVELPSSELDPVCHSSGPRVALVFTHRPTEELATPTATLRSILKRMNWKFTDQASQSSEEDRPLKLITDCTGGEVNVYDVATEDNAYSTISSAVEGQLNSQLGSGPIKYLVFEQGTAGEVGGLSLVLKDNRKSWLNWNAQYNNVALVYNIAGAWETHVPVHELLHSMGASQGGTTPAPPKSTSGAHCYDGIDVLCYDDGGGYWDTYCPESEGYEEPANVPIDCGTDTYFDAAPEPESWLDEYWNVGGYENPLMAGPPRAVTGEPVQIEGTFAQVEVEVDPGGYDTSYVLEYGTTEEYGSVEPVPSATMGGNVPEETVYMWLSDLSPKTTYHYRVTATNAAGTSHGTDRQLETLPTPAVATTDATGVGSDEATLHGTVNPNGFSTEYWFEYGTDKEYGHSAPVEWEGVGSGSEAVEVEEELDGLEPGTVYHYRLVAVNAYGFTEGTDHTFATTLTYGGSFGSEGPDDGELSLPADGAVDSEGNLWVADKGNDRVQKFNAEGEYLDQFGVQGSGNGQFEGPCAVAVNSEDDIWVGDCGNHRIQKFNSAGEYLGQFGSQGSGNGQFGVWGPKGIAIDASDNLWVSDYSTRIQKFNQAGEFVKAVGSYGSGEGQFKESAGIGIGLGGRIWVSDWVNHRVNVFDESGEFLFQFGSEGSGNGQFKHPDGVEVDAKGGIWVLDEGNSRVQQFNETGEYRSDFGAEGSGEGQFDFSWPAGLTSDDKGNLWVADSDNDRIQRWLIPKFVPNFQESFGSSGTGDGQFGAPTDVAVDAEGNLWVTDDAAADRVQKFNAEGEYLSQFGSTGNGNGQFSGVRAIAVGPSGHLWVVDRNNHRVQEFNGGGEYLSQFGSYGSEDGHFDRPSDIAIDEEGDIWICDDYNDRVQKFNKAGEFLQAIAPVGEGHLYGCNGIDIGPDGRVWVASRDSHDINVFNKAGEYLFTIDDSGSGPGQLYGPVAIEVDHEGGVWVVEQYNDRVQRFNGYGEYVTEVGSYGTGEEQFNFYNPYLGITTDQDGSIWITDDGNDRVQKWSFAPPPPPPPLVTTKSAASIKAHTAVLRATVNPRGTATTYQFEYGPSGEYVGTAPAEPTEVGSGEEAVEVETPIEGLESGTGYQFRVVATSEAGSAYGSLESLTTVSPPSVTTKAATGLSETGATLKAVINPNGAATTYQFEYGPTSEYGETIPIEPQELGSEEGDVKVRERLEELEPGGTYHFRVSATNEAGTVEGPDREFTLPEEFPWEETHFEAEGYPVILSGEAAHEFTFPGNFYTEWVKCGQPNFETVMGAIVSDLAFDLEANECTSSTGKTTVADMNSCQYVLALPAHGSPSESTLDVACEEEEDAIEISVYWSSAQLILFCGIEIPPQQNLESVGFSSVGEGASAGVDAEIQVEGIEYSGSGMMCGGYGEGGLALEATLKGVSEEEEEVGVYVVEN